MKLISVYDYPGAEEILLDLLRERTPEQSISHKSLPTRIQHRMFIGSQPYKAWYLIEVSDVVGAIYLTYYDEIGIFIFKAHRGKGYAPRAILELMEEHPRMRYLANINPLNHQSEQMFKKMGFKHIQNTYSYEP